jgi:hypothetical protein
MNNHEDTKGAKGSSDWWPLPGYLALALIANANGVSGGALILLLLCAAWIDVASWADARRRPLS